MTIKCVGFFFPKLWFPTEYRAEKKDCLFYVCGQFHKLWQFKRLRASTYPCVTAISGNSLHWYISYSPHFPAPY